MLYYSRANADKDASGSFIVLKDQMSKFSTRSNSPEETMRLGRRMGESLQAGSVIALTGELGCGKTLLTRGICGGLDVPLQHVNSPTFILVNEYQGRMPVFHMDMYQLADASDGIELGMIDYLSRIESGIMIIEWAERIMSLLPEDTLKVRFDILAENRRHLVFECSSDKYRDLFREFTG